MSAMLFGLLGSVKKAYPLEWVTVTLTSGTLWSKPVDMIGDTVYVSGCGAGGGGGACSSSYSGAAGGSGGASVSMYEYYIGSAGAVDVEIGAGGAGGVPPDGNGGDGGNTRFGTLVIPGGVGGLGGKRINYTASPLYREVEGVKTSTEKSHKFVSVINMVDGGYGGKFYAPGGRPVWSAHAGGTTHYGGGGGASLYGPGGDGFDSAAGGNGAPVRYGGGGGGEGNYNLAAGVGGAPGANGVLFITYPRRLLA